MKRFTFIQKIFIEKALRGYFGENVSVSVFMERISEIDDLAILKAD